MHASPYIVAAQTVSSEAIKMSLIWFDGIPLLMVYLVILSAPGAMQNKPCDRVPIQSMLFESFAMAMTTG